MIYSKRHSIAILLLLFSLTITHAQKTAGIYHFTMTIDREMLTLHSSRDESRNWFSGSSTEIDIPAEYADSIKSITIEALRKKKNLDAECLYATTKGGRAYESMETLSPEKASIAGLPMSPFKKAAEQFSKDQYLQIMVNIEDGKGVSVDLGNGRKKIKPMISMTIKAYDANKDLIWKDDLEIKNLTKLRRTESQTGSVKKKEGQVLTAEMILGMYELLADSWAGN